MTRMSLKPICTTRVTHKQACATRMTYISHTACMVSLRGNHERHERTRKIGVMKADVVVLKPHCLEYGMLSGVGFPPGKGVRVCASDFVTDFLGDEGDSAEPAMKPIPTVQRFSFGSVGHTDGQTFFFFECGGWVGDFTKHNVRAPLPPQGFGPFAYGRDVGQADKFRGFAGLMSQMSCNRSRGPNSPKPSAT